MTLIESSLKYNTVQFTLGSLERIIDLPQILPVIVLIDITLSSHKTGENNTPNYVGVLPYL